MNLKGYEPLNADCLMYRSKRDLWRLFTLSLRGLCISVNWIKPCLSQAEPKYWMRLNVTCVFHFCSSCYLLGCDLVPFCLSFSAVTLVTLYRSGTAILMGSGQCECKGDHLLHCLRLPSYFFFSPLQPPPLCPVAVILARGVCQRALFVHAQTVLL